jgi:hypothetical protein
MSVGSVIIPLSTTRKGQLMSFFTDSLESSDDFNLYYELGMQNINSCYCTNHSICTICAKGY